MHLNSLRFLPLFLGLIAAAMTASAKDDSKPAPAPAPAPAHSTKPARSGKLNHVVSFKFKDSATKEQIREVEEAFRALKTKIPQIQKLQWGMNNSPEGLNKGFTHCWVLTFVSDADRDAYLVHPDHKEFGKLLKPVLGDVFVIDFWGKD